MTAFALIIGPWLLVAGLAALWLRVTRREPPPRPAQQFHIQMDEPSPRPAQLSHVRILGWPGQPGENEGERAGLVGRESPVDPVTPFSPSSPPIDFDAEVVEALAISDPVALARLRRIVGDGSGT